MKNKKNKDITISHTQTHSKMQHTVFNPGLHNIYIYYVIDKAAHTMALYIIVYGEMLYI